MQRLNAGLAKPQTANPRQRIRQKSAMQHPVGKSLLSKHYQRGHLGRPSESQLNFGAAFFDSTRRSRDRIGARVNRQRSSLQNQELAGAEPG